MPEKKRYDVVILGTGPAGLQAAIHAARKKAAVLVLGKESKSSIYHHHVENYCCILSTTGEDIIKAGRQQAVSFGAELVDEDVLSLAAEAGCFRIRLESGSDISAGALILATGTSRNSNSHSGLMSDSVATKRSPSARDNRVARIVAFTCTLALRFMGRKFFCPL